jgi:hypothetical protein
MLVGSSALKKISIRLAIMIGLSFCPRRVLCGMDNADGLGSGRWRFREALPVSLYLETDLDKVICLSR